MLLDGASQQRIDVFARRIERSDARRLGRRLQSPVGPRLPFPAGEVDRQSRRRRQPLYALVDRAVAGHVAPRQHGVRSVVVDGEQTRKRLPVSIEAAQFGAKGERRAGVCDEQRLDPEPVAAQDDTASPPIVDRERPHPDELFLDVVRVVLVQSQDDLGITPRAEPDAATLQLATEQRGVVDLTVVDDDDRLVFVRHRLLAVGDVDDGETHHPQRRVRMGNDTAPVGTAVRDGGRHRTHEGLASIEPRVNADETDYPAHRCLGVSSSDPRQHLNSDQVRAPERAPTLQRDRGHRDAMTRLTTRQPARSARPSAIVAGTASQSPRMLK